MHPLSLGYTVWVGYQGDVFAGSPWVAVCNFVYLSGRQISSTVHISDLRFESTIEKLLLFLPNIHWYVFWIDVFWIAV